LFLVGPEINWMKNWNRKINFKFRGNDRWSRNVFFLLFLWFLPIKNQCLQFVNFIFFCLTLQIFGTNAQFSSWPR
jgi:hypothetical protein